jgi:ParB-like chromosome segregation protein Spo0J/N6-adenosine-specific RNA methylase IME4
MAEETASAGMPRRTPTIVPIARLRLSRFNARTQRAAPHITTLAERIQRNGFEVTRALWVYPVDEHYEVFAGGTRLAAVREAGLADVPVLIHEGYDETAISRLADEDNENDEYHVPVPLPDVWTEYRRLHSQEKWSQREIATAKGVALGLVNARIAFAGFPAEVLDVFNQGLLKEDHARELDKCSKFEHLTPWLTREQVLTEILHTPKETGILDKHRGSTAGVPPTAHVFATAVKTWNGMLKTAEDAIKGFPATVDDNGKAYVPRTAFLTLLAKEQVRTTKDVIIMVGRITTHLQVIEDQRLTRLRERQRRLTEEQEAAEREAERLAMERARAAYLERMLACLQHGDCRLLIPAHCPDEIRLVLTDPPYGKQFRSHRRVATEKKTVMTGDASLADAADLLGAMLAVLIPKLATEAHLFIFTHQDSYEDFCQVIRDAGLTLRRTMTWMKGNHGMGDVTGGEALSETEWVIHAVHGNPKFTEGIDRSELLDFPGVQDSAHPTEKPIELLRHLILRASQPGEVIVDPFAGTANTLLAALHEQRQGWVCEVDEGYYREGAQKLYGLLQPPTEAA